MSFNDLPNEVLDIIFNDLICVNGVYNSKAEMKSTPLMLELKKVFDNNFCAEHFGFSNLARTYPKNNSNLTRTYPENKPHQNHSVSVLSNYSFALHPQDYHPSGTINIAKTCSKCVKTNTMFSGIVEHGSLNTLAFNPYLYNFILNGSSALNYSI